MIQIPELDQDKFTEVMDRISEALQTDPHHRLLSWDHAWEHRQKFSKQQNGDEELAALHLAFYLASWGMYRGSSDLLFRDFKVLIPVVRFLKQAAADQWEDCIFQSEDASCVAKKLQELGKLAGTLKEKLARPEKKQADINVSDTLLSKILLNTFVCVPAFDTELKSALRDIFGTDYPTGCGFDDKRLVPTIELARKNVQLLERGQDTLRTRTHKTYPLTMVFDLYLWHHGFDLSQNEKVRVTKRRSAAGWTTP